jgi:protein phosphatase
VIISVPAGAMVLLIGPSGCGKSTFAARHFAPTEVLSSDQMRAAVADDEHDQAATEAAFELLHTVLSLRLARRRLSVVDATNVEHWARQLPLSIARRFGRPPVAIIFALPLDVCLRRNLSRPRPRPPAALRRQHRWLTDSLASLPGEGFAAVWVLSSEAEVDAAVIDRLAAVSPATR